MKDKKEYAAKSRDQYHAWRAKGLCGGCGVRRPKDKSTLCVDCRERRKARMVEKKKKGICQSCARTSHGQLYCVRHRKLNVQRVLKSRQKHIQKGLCSLCSIPVNQFRGYCDKHGELRRERKRLARRIKYGIPLDMPVRRSGRRATAL